MTHCLDTKFNSIKLLFFKCNFFEIQWFKTPKVIKFLNLKNFKIFMTSEFFIFFDIWPTKPGLMSVIFFSVPLDGRVVFIEIKPRNSIILTNLFINSYLKSKLNGEFWTKIYQNVQFKHQNLFKICSFLSRIKNYQYSFFTAYIIINIGVSKPDAIKSMLVRRWFTTFEISSSGYIGGLCWNKTKIYISFFNFYF